MIDFTNKTFIKLKEIDNNKGKDIVRDLLIEKENIIASFSSIRDKLIFTNKRIISVNVQGLTGSKIDYTSIPYSKIQAYSIETSGMLDLDCELDITISGLGTIRFELHATSNIKNICKQISEIILN